MGQKKHSRGRLFSVSCSRMFDPDFLELDFGSNSDSDSCDDEFGLVDLFGDKKPTACPWSDDDDDDYYTVPIEESDGFYVANTNRMYIDRNTRCMDYDMFSQLAVKEYNRRYKDANGELEFVKVLAALSQSCNIMMLYINFEAKDLADGGTIKIYQAVVWWTVGAVTVESFRLKPPEEQEGSGNHGNEWFWKGH